MGEIAVQPLRARLLTLYFFFFPRAPCLPQAGSQSRVADEVMQVSCQLYWSQQLSLGSADDRPRGDGDGEAN
jgi:hypothetical protein